MEENNLQVQPPIVTEPKPVRPWLKIVLFVALGVILVGGLVFAAVKIGVPTKPRERACTEEAKICPDGSAVGRTGPNCEFAPCPNQAVADETAGWKTYNDPEYQFQIRYPPELILELNAIGPGSEGAVLSGTKIHLPEGVSSEEGGTIGIFILSTPLDVLVVAREKSAKSKVTQIEVAEQRAQKIEWFESLGATGITTFNQSVFFTYKGATYEASLFINNSSPKKEEFLEIYNQILSTFKFLGQSRTDETIGWKTYRNDRYGYTFSYPSVWFLQEASKTSYGGVDILTSYKSPETQVKDPDFFRDKLKIDISRSLKQMDKNQTLEAWVNEHGNYGGQSVELAQETITLEGKKAIKMSREIIGVEKHKIYLSYFIEKDNYVFFIHVFGDLTPRNQESLNRILATFKFLDQSQADETANWKTYANTNYGFSFKYPSEWNINVPSFEGKHESNKTLLRIDVKNSLDFKNAALLGNKKDILNVSISVWDNENAKSFESVLAEWDNFFQNPKPNSTSINEISQIKWTRRELINASNLPIVEFVTLKGKYFYVAVVSPQDSTLIDFADLILSTFRFLE